MASKLRIFISTTSFASLDETPRKMLHDSGLEVSSNPHGRKLTKEEISDLASFADGLIAGTETLDAGVLRKLKKLKVISRCGAGVDNVDLEAARELGIKVFNTPDAPTQAVAELAIGLILSLLRKISLSDREIKSGKWEKRMGALLQGKTVGIVGFGRIGRRVAGILKPFEVKILYADPRVDQEGAGENARVELGELLRRSDIITLHLSHSGKGTYLIGEGELGLMKKDAVLINCSRGGIVDEKALGALLRGGKLAGAALDVFEQEPYEGPLKELENVILTPHIGSYAKEARVEMEILTVKNLLEGLRG